jgi:hypothetical protein
MDNTNVLLQIYDLLSSFHIKQEKKQDSDITKTLNEINLIPTISDGQEVYIDETKKETTGGNERKIQVMYY